MEKQECAICLENIEKIVIYDCGHYSCNDCFVSYLKTTAGSFKCHLCRSGVGKVMKSDHIINIQNITDQDCRKRRFLSMLASISKYFIFVIVIFLLWAITVLIFVVK
jgi:hypothetical protein